VSSRICGWEAIAPVNLYKKEVQRRCCGSELTKQMDTYEVQSGRIILVVKKKDQPRLPKATPNFQLAK